MKLFCWLFLLGAWASAGDSLPPFPADFELAEAGFERIDSLSCVKIHLIYSQKENFLKENIYQSYEKAWLHKDGAKKLRRVCELIAKEIPGQSLLVYDALRPRRVQFVMRQKAIEMKKSLYVARGDKGSIHNFGMAVDLTLLDAQGNPLDMGTPVDYFGPLAQPQNEMEMLESGLLKKHQLENRLLLRGLMQRGGWVQLPSEWWHFNGASAKWIRQNYKWVD